jgi:hypothetical protein
MPKVEAFMQLSRAKAVTQVRIVCDVCVWVGGCV